MNMNNSIRLALEISRENWDSVLRALQTARRTTGEKSDQQQLDMACHLIDHTLNDKSAQQLLDSPMEVQSKIPIQVKLVTGNWS